MVFMPIKVGVYGASGYSGGELLRILLNHKKVEIKWVTSRGEVPLEELHRNLVGSGLRFTKPEKVNQEVDVVFLCTPHGVSMEVAPQFLEKGVKVIDLSADFRLKNSSIYKKAYGKEHTAQKYLDGVVYGLPELKRDEIKKAKLVANPGCFATSMILGLAPIISTDLIDLKKIVVDAKTGTSGAGANPSLFTHHSEIGAGITGYSAVKHRHTYEVEQELVEMAKKDVSINFTPHLAPFIRGILSTIHVFLNKPISREKMLEIYSHFYKDEYFVKVLEFKKEEGKSHLPYPNPANLAGSNFCQIGLDLDEERKRAVIFSAIDNLGKGASTQAVQNMNIMFGLDETEGIGGAGLHP